MKYKVYVRWPGQRVTDKTTTESKAVADAAWTNLANSQWNDGRRPLGFAYTGDGKQVDYVDLSALNNVVMP